jgi:hypothetical protein
MPSKLSREEVKARRMDPRWKIKLSKIYVKYEKAPVRVEDHPYTRSLSKKDRHLYEKTIFSSKHQSQKDTSTWENFIRLRKKIKTEGYRPGLEPIMLKWKKGSWWCSHGRHRICLLRDIYGPDAFLVVTQVKQVAYVWKVLHSPGRKRQSLH